MFAFASGVPLDIKGFYPYTKNSNILYQTQVKQFWQQHRSYAPVFHCQLTRQPAHSLRPVIPSNAWTLRITATAGTKLVSPYSSGTVIIFPDKRVLQSYDLHHSRGIAGSGLRPLPNIPHCCLP